MTSLVNKVKMDSVEAMRNKEKEKLSTLRLLVAELEKEKVQHKLTEITGLSDEQALQVINRQIKKLDKEIEAYVAVGRSKEKQEAEKKVLLTYLPEQMTREEIISVIKHALELVAKGEIDKPQPYIAQRCKGKADMKLVMQIMKEM